jgi:spore maturation protein CgeB
VWEVLATYLQKNYHDGYNIVYSDLDNPEQMAADVKWLLENPESAEKIAMRGYETAKKYDTWECRFKYVIERMQEVIGKRC